MQQQEATAYQRTDYLASFPTDLSNVVDGTWRQRIVEWMYGVVDHCNLRRDSVAVAAHYMDLCVERGVVESRQHFQLAAMTALQLAIKLYDSTIVKLDSMIKLGRGLFTEQDVIDMEIKMLRALKWQVHPPTQICFLRQYMRLLPGSVSPHAKYTLAELTRFIAEISVCLYKFVDSPPSVLAYAGMLVSLERIDEITLPPWQRQEIFQTMQAAADLDHQSPLVQNTMTKLRISLGKNVSLQDLLHTIDAQCQAGGYYDAKHPHATTPTTSSTTSKDKQRKVRPATGALSSPRDVACTRQRRA